MTRIRTIEEEERLLLWAKKNDGPVPICGCSLGKHRSVTDIQRDLFELRRQNFLIQQVGKNAESSGAQKGARTH